MTLAFRWSCSSARKPWNALVSPGNTTTMNLLISPPERSATPPADADAVPGLLGGEFRDAARDTCRIGAQPVRDRDTGRGPLADRRPGGNAAPPCRARASRTAGRAPRSWPSRRRSASTRVAPSQDLKYSDAPFSRDVRPDLAAPAARSGTATRAPTATPRTPSPTAMTVPAASVPGMAGGSGVTAFA